MYVTGKTSLFWAQPSTHIKFVSSYISLNGLVRTCADIASSIWRFSDVHF